MKYFIFVLSLCGLSSAYAANACAKYEGQARYLKAIEVVAKDHDLTLEELCNLPKIWDVEAQPSRIIIRDGTVIPHVRVQLHQEYSSCLFMVNELTYTITKQNCYSGT